MAIAFDSVSSVKSAVDVTGLSVTHTNTGSNLTLAAVITIGGNAASIVGATYGSSSMVQAVVAGPDGDNNKAYIFYLANPATGANNLTCTFSGNASPVSLGGISLTGTNSSPLGNTATGTPTTTASPSVTITTGAANSWVVDGLVTGSFTAGDTMTVTGSNQTSRFAHNVSGFGNAGGSTQTTTSAGNYAGTWTDSGANHNWAYARIEIKAPGGGGTAGLLNLLGVGT